MKGHVVIKDNLSPIISDIKKELHSLPQDALKQFVKETPKQTGNARSKTKLNNSTIEANYPYAKKLDDGYSNKAPDGMTKPTEKWLEQKFKQIFRK